MMHFHVISAFPAMFAGVLGESMMRRAVDKKVVQFHIHDLRAYAHDKHATIDDYPFGGGAGMILKPEPIFRAVEDIISTFSLRDPRIVLTSAAGQTFNQKTATRFASDPRGEFIIICGHYKGIDDRVRTALATHEISIGDYVLTGGELPALVMMDAIVRLLPGVLGDFDSAAGDSFQEGILDAPYFTRPRSFRNFDVPDVLLSGHHSNIEEWRRNIALEMTRARRGDLVNKLDNDKNS